jgi:hypothetical protein
MKRLLLILPLAACGVKAEPPLPQLGLSNPASMYCASKGGTVSIRNEGGAQVGYCTLPDGTTVEEWKLYRAENPGVDP